MIKKPNITKGEWGWLVLDYSMASLGEGDCLENHVLSVSPCRSCQSRMKDGDDPMGRCTMPNWIDAKAIAQVPNMIDTLIETYKYLDSGDGFIKDDIKQVLIDAGCEFIED